MIYRALLEGDFERLPPILRKFHSAPGNVSAAGAMSIRRQNRFLAWLVGFPQAGERVPVTLDVAAARGRETWTRTFGDTVRRSTQRAVGGLLVEQTGPVRIAFRVRACESGMSFESQRTQIWGMPVPLRIEASVRAGAISWEVEVRFAHIGSYRGVMTLKS